MIELIMKNNIFNEFQKIIPESITEDDFNSKNIDFKNLKEKLLIALLIVRELVLILVEIL